MTELKISDDLRLPIDTATAALALIGQRGVGKTHAESVLVEELVRAGVPTCVLDPLGVMWGLRSSADGKSDGLPAVILGGEHGDLPLEPASGKVIADWVVEERRAVVLDLSSFRKNEQRQFSTDFAEELYRRNREPLHLVVDEVDLFAPQRPMPGEQRMLGAFEDLVRRGRARGIGITIATQRPAVVHKDILTQVSVLIALRLTGPQDIAAVEAWIRSHGSEAERRKVLDSLPSLPIGTAWFWSPGWLELLKKVRVRGRTTFDSSATPKVGARRIEPQKLAPVDLEALSERIAETIERAKAEDPKALRARIAELERQLSEQPEPTTVEKPVLDERAIQGIHALNQQVSDLNRAVGELTGKVDGWSLRAVASAVSTAVPRRNAVYPGPEGPSPAKVRQEPSAATPSPRTGATSSLVKAERLILTVLAQQAGKPMTRERLALLVGYHANSKSFTNGLGALRGRGAVDGLSITASGLTELGRFERLPTGPALLEWYCSNRLNGPEARILRMIAARRTPLEREQLAKAVGYHPNAKSFTNGIGRLRGLGLVDGLTLSEDLR
ncbi:MAG TPA: hypothetical protein VG734_25605 [Lacunisphaera sp.]|nr:hypothetical protein [Lacunisphaera sp.]